MPVLHQLQPSFNNGEISPLLYDRVDYNKFTSSVKSGKNMFVHPQGGMSNRAGTKMLGKANGEKVRLIPFEFSNTETYMIEFGNEYCRFYTTNGQVVTEDGLPYEIPSPFKTEDLDKIRYCQSADVMYIAWGGKPQTLIRYGHTDWKFADYDYKNGPININEDYTGKINKTESTSSFNYIGIAGTKGNTSSFIPVGSADLTFWQILEQDYSFLRNAVLCNGVLFSAVGGVLYYSTNGISWIKLLDNVSYQFSIASNGLFYLLSTGIKMYRFENFVSLVELDNLPFQENTVDGIYFQNELFFIDTRRTSTQNPKIFYTKDTVSWKEINVKGKVVYFNNKYYSFSKGSDSFNVFDIDLNFEKQIYLEGNIYTADVGVCNNTIYLLVYPRNSADYYLYKSTDGENFVLVQSNSDYKLGGLYFYGEENFVRLGYHFYQITKDNNLEEKFYNDELYYINKVIPFFIESTPESYVLSSNDYVFSDKNSYNNFLLKIKLDAQTITGHLKLSEGSSAGALSSKTVLVNGNWSLITSGSWNGHIDIWYSYDNEDWKVYRAYSSATETGGANYNVSGSFEETVFVRIGGSITGEISYSFNLNNSEVYMFVKGLGKQTQNSAYISPEKEHSAFIDYVLDSEGILQTSPWGVFSYYPTEVDLYQDRIVWATNNQLDATKISDYTNFGVSTEVTADDAISVIIKDKKINKINSAIAGSQLVVFTDSGNFIHNNDTFTPSSATFLNQGSTGGADVKPVIVRDNIIYVHPMKQAISDYAYSFETDGYAGQDITLLANHLFDNKKIKELAYQQEPYSIIWVLQEEGTMLACTYLRQQNVIAWTPMDFGGKVISMGVMSNGSNQELYLAVERKNGVFIEKMPYRMLDNDPKERFFVDCGSTYRGEPANIIAGLEYLEGESVVALADGYVVKDLVVENGQITLPTPASIVTVGLPYESVLETLTFDVSQGDGSNLNRKKRVVAVSVRYNNSRGSRISVNGHREVPMLERKIDNKDTDISLKSGFYREILPSAHNEPTTIKIRQDEPLPLTIVSIIPELEYER